MNLEIAHVGGPKYDLTEIADPFQLFHFELTRTAIREEAICALTSVTREIAESSRFRGPVVEG